MSRFRRRIHVSFLLLYADAVTAIHEGPGHASRHEAPIDELMRRDGFRVSSRPLSKTSRAKDDAEAMPISEQAQKDFKAVEAVLAEGTPVRLPDLDSDSLQERLGRHGDVSTREESDALLQENAGAAPPYGPLGLGSLGSFSNFGSMGYGPGMSSGASSGSPFLSSFSGVLGSPKSPSPSGMPMPPLASSVASKESKDKKELFASLDNFDVDKANSGLPPQYIFVIVSPILSLCIDILLGMIKSGFPLRFICCYVLSILFGTILFSGAVQIRISFFMCERFAAPYKPGCCDWLQSVILFLVSAVVGITGFLLSVIAYSTSLGASLAWCAFAICIFGLSHLDWECEEAKRRCCGAPLETSPTTDEDSHVSL